MTVLHTVRHGAPAVGDNEERSFLWAKNDPLQWNSLGDEVFNPAKREFKTTVVLNAHRCRWGSLTLYIFVLVFFFDTHNTSRYHFYWLRLHVYQAHRDEGDHDLFTYRVFSTGLVIGGETSKQNVSTQELKNRNIDRWLQALEVLHHAVKSWIGFCL